MYLCMYMNRICPLGLCFKPDLSKGFKCYADTDFAGTFVHEFAAADPSIAKSCFG